MINFLFIICLGVLYDVSLIIFIKKVNKKIILCNYNLVLLLFMFVFSVMFPMCYVLSIKGFNYNVDFVKYFHEFNSVEILLYYLCIFIVTHSYLYSLRRKKINTFSINETVTNNNLTIIKKIKIIAYIMLFLGLISNFLYLKAYGGYFNYLNYSKLIRGGIFLLDNKFSFLAPFRSCIIFSCYLFLAIWKSEKKKYLDFIMFTITFILSIFVLYSNNGRLSFVLFLLMILLFWMFSKSKVNTVNFKSIITIVAIVCLGGYLLVFVGNTLGRNSINSIVTELNEEISFAFLNFKVINNKSFSTDYRFLKDIIYMPLYILPSSFWSSNLGIKTSDAINTKIWKGSFKGENGNTGTMPIDFVSISYLQFGIIGLFVIPVIYGWIISKILEVIKTLDNKFIYRMLYIYLFLNVIFDAIFYADPQHIISNIYPFIIFMILYYFFKKIKIDYKTKNLI